MSRNVSLLLASVVLLLLGCGTSGKDFSLDTAQQIKLGVTDKATVVRYLGQPQARSRNNADENWTYSYNEISSSVSPVAFIPFVGSFIPNTIDSKSSMKMLMIGFKRDIVSSCKIMIFGTTGTGGGVFNVVSGGVNQKDMYDCDYVPQ